MESSRDVQRLQVNRSFWALASRLCAVALLIVGLGGSARDVLAQSPDSPAVDAGATADVDSAPSQPTEPDDAGSVETVSIWSVLFTPVSIVIILLSIGAVALMVEHVMTIREPVLMPPNLGEDVRALLEERQWAPAAERCREDPSFLGFVLQAGLSETDAGWPAVEKAMEDAAADQSARLFRKIEYLSVIGNIAPMLGLLGTVIGMIFAFREVANTQGAARAADLAQGIYLALVTTVEGLIVAIPALGAFAVFRNRVDQLVAEASYAAGHALLPLKRAIAAGRTRAAGGQKPPPTGGR